MRCAWVLREVADHMPVHVAADRAWAHAPEDPATIAACTALIQRHREVYWLGEQACDVSRPAAELTAEEEAERARRAREVVKELARMKMQQWVRGASL